MTTKVHSVTLDSTRSPEEIGKDIARLRFDVMLRILRACWQEISKQAQADQKRQRYQLAQALFDAADRFGPVIRCLDLAWRISKPHMKHELSDSELEKRWFKELNKPTSGIRRLTDAFLARG